MEQRLIELLRLALRYACHDIHFKQNKNEISMEMRVNGVMRNIKTKFDDYRLVQYLQYLANLDVSNLLTPQTGEFNMEIDGQMLKLRYATINTANSSSGVLRILSQEIKQIPDDIKPIALHIQKWAELNAPKLILVTGPTGSGKTTFCYNIMKSIKNCKKYSVQDPVEIYCDDMIQIAVNDETGMTYENCIKQILRHDPDVIYIDEIRSSECARMATIAANTGHTVIAIMHAPDCSKAIQRMIEYGVDEKQLKDTLLYVVNARLMIDKKGKKTQLFETANEDEIRYYIDNHQMPIEHISISSVVKTFEKYHKYKRIEYNGIHNTARK